MSMGRAPAGSPSGKTVRPRLPVVFGGLLLLWTALGYGRFGGEGLSVLVGLAVVLAAALPRPLAGTSRAVIWTGVLAITLCLAMNLERISPPLPGGERNLIGGFDAFPYDRIATVALGLGLTALFFRPSRTTVTVLAVACLPPMMLAMERAGEKGGGWSAGFGFAWVGFGMLALTAQAQQYSRPRPAGVASARPWEWLVRAGVPLALLALATPLAPRLASASAVGRDWFYAKVGLRMSSRAHVLRSGTLSVLSPPAGFAGRLRPLLAIESPHAPGYLREAAYHAYHSRRWSVRVAEAQAPESLPEANGTPTGWLAHGVGEGNGREGFRDVWSVRMLQPRHLLSLCLPGRARAVVLPEGVELELTTDGIATLAEGVPATEFQVWTATAAEDAAFPWPPPGSQDAFHAIPRQLAASVSNWVSACEGLASAADVRAARDAVVRHFHRNFRYRLGSLPFRGDPLEAFMTAREGHCTLFASASALMLRACGIPTRLVGGFLCTERHSYTGRWVVRERDGHAWCEAWDADAGRWILVESTPPGGLPGALPPPGRLRLLWEFVGHSVRQFKDWIRTSHPLSLLAEALAAVFEWVRFGIASPAGVALLGFCGALVGVRWWRRRSGEGRDAQAILRAEVVQTMEAVQRRWVPADLRRPAHEPWTQWWTRVGAKLPPERMVPLRDLLEGYQTLRYSPHLDLEQAGIWLKTARRQRPLRRNPRVPWRGCMLATFLLGTSGAVGGQRPPGARWRGFNLTDLTRRDSGASSFRESDFRQIADWGFNFVRLPLSYQFWVDPSDWTQVREEKLAPIDEAVEWGRMYGLHVCLNFHRAPGHCINPPAEPRSLWTAAQARAACAAHWAVFARRYRGIPGSALSFNLLNEPPHGVSEATYREVVEELVRAIRAQDPDRPIIVDGMAVGSRPILSLAGLDVMQSTRGYEPRALTHYRADWAPGYDRPPVWPPAGVASAYLCGPQQQALHSPLVLNGPFPRGVLRMTVGTVSDVAVLQVLIDGAPVLKEEFRAAEGGGAAEPVYQAAWKNYRTRYDRTLAVPVPEGAKTLRVEVVEGDWLCLRDLEFADGHGQRALLAITETWGRRQPAVQFAAMTLRPDSESPDAWLRSRLIDSWKPAVAAGIPVMVGEWGAYNKTSHDITLRWMEDCLRLWKEQGWGWALWNFRGDFGVLDSGRADVDYVEHDGHLLDARMLELLRRY